MTGRITCAWLLLCCAACEPPADGSGKQASSAPEQPAPPAEPAPAPPSFKRSRTMMGTIISITVLGAPESKAAAPVDAAFREMEGLEAILSEWRPDSEISRINAAAGSGKPVRVGPHTLAVVKAGVDVSRWSEGAFDLSWAAMRGLYSFQPGEEKVPTPEEIAERLPLIDYQQIVVDEAASTVELRTKGMIIGTGAIAKGYALDRASEILAAAGLDSFMLFGGGQVQVRGMKGNRPWRVGIQHPRRADYFAFLEATGGSIATSGDYERAFIQNGKRWHHIIDPARGLPVDHTTSVTVHAESGLYADALSTAVFVMGAEQSLARIDSAPGKPQVAIVDANLKLHLSPTMSKRLAMRVELSDGKLPP